MNALIVNPRLVKASLMSSSETVALRTKMTNIDGPFERKNETGLSEFDNNLRNVGQM